MPEPTPAGLSPATGDAVLAAALGALEPRPRRFLDAELDARLLRLVYDASCDWWRVQQARHVVFVHVDTTDEQVAAIEARGFVVRRHRWAIGGMAVVIDRAALTWPITGPIGPGSAGFRDIAPIDRPSELNGIGWVNVPRDRSRLSITGA